ncbi:MAG TPA: G5 domain-containing protein [Anaerolineaceae bacterium]|nr:G5 domain-containing protein [Anaerolineaceae bacterium]
MPGTARRLPVKFITARLSIALLVIGSLMLLAGCQSLQQSGPGSFQVSIHVDQRSVQLEVPAGTTVSQALDMMYITRGDLDRVEPLEATTLRSGDLIRVIRVRETFAVEETAIPFERQTVNSETLPESERRILQPGADGLAQVTYRVLSEDGIELSRQVVDSITLSAPIPEIVMLGTQPPFAQWEIPGTLAYLSAGQAWIMRGSTGERAVLPLDGALDGRVFSLSPDGRWLLFTQSAESETNPTAINTLWVASTDLDHFVLIDLKVKDVAHAASWIPGPSLKVAYSTVEPRESAPGWQANNDLWTVSFTDNGKVAKPLRILDTNAGGVYGWWGMTFIWSPDGSQVAYTRPDGVGLVDLKGKKLEPLIENEPYLSPSSWAWTPCLRWSPDGEGLYTVRHARGTSENKQVDPGGFDLVEIELSSGSIRVLESQVGMQAAIAVQIGPHASPDQLALLRIPPAAEIVGDASYHLQLISSDITAVTDFSSEKNQGFFPQALNWSPQAVKDVGKLLAVIYQGNLWFFPIKGHAAIQVTGEGTISRVDWK